MNIISLSPLDSLFPLFSWKVKTGLETVNRVHCRYCQSLNANGGVGLAAQTQWLRRAVYFAFAELDAGYSSAFARHYRIGGGGTVGLLLSPAKRWKMLASGTYLRYPLGEDAGAFGAFFGQSYALRRNWALRFEYRHRERDNEIAFRLLAYF